MAVSTTPSERASPELARDGGDESPHGRHGRKSAAAVAAKTAPAEKAAHIAFATRPSMLSTEHPDNNYRGFVNVIIILLILANMRIVIQNLVKYGVLVRPSSILLLAKIPNVVLALSIWIYLFAAYGIETLHGRVPGPVYSTLHWLNCLASFLGTWYGMWYLQTDPGGGIIVLVFAVTAFMKITSFIIMCQQLRADYAAKDKVYRATLGQWLYFIAAPTLVYKDQYPRTKRIRKGWLGRRVAEFVGLWAGIFIVATQYVVPSVDNTFLPMETGNVLLILEGVMKIAVPNFIIWLLGFYAIFHVYLNILAELTRFGDRQFYRDWWNSTTLGYFWRSWNLPVHAWMVAHVYLPLTHRGWRKSTASLLIFFISAALHELVVSIPFWNFKLLAFGGMLAQVVLIELTKPLKGTQTGNVIFWLTIMLGQPMIVLLYARDYQTGMYGPWTEADTKTVGKILLGFSQVFNVMNLRNISNLEHLGLRPSAQPPPPSAASAPDADGSDGVEAVPPLAAPSKQLRAKFGKIFALNQASEAELVK
eukprot:Tamp_10020.p1 GENE.Tamp_10020~~Tamp_10020.p1  ORF type:complete len:534 (-),score=131.92 Tamp_10020:436-2037(-)